MFLQEEYLMRHGIHNVPIINHITNGSIFLKTDYEARPYSETSDKHPGYLLMTISWKDHDRHPGIYFINYHIPSHNGYANGNFFYKISEVERIVEWDEYYSYISGWAKGRVVPVYGDKAEVILAAWEIFIFCCDSTIADLANAYLDKLIYKSLDQTATISQRLHGYQQCLSYIGMKFPYMFAAFKNNILPYVQNYCYWLAKLVKFYNS